MRILVLNHNLRERGTWFRAREVARGLHARGHDVTFVYTGEGWYRPRRDAPEDRWTEFGTPSWTPLRDAGEGYSPLGLLHRAFALRGRFDLVYTFSHLPVDQATARLLARRCGFWMTDWCDLWNSRRGGLLDLSHWPRPIPARMRGVVGGLRRASFRIDDALESSAARSADSVSIIATPMRAYTRKLGIPDSRVLHLVSGADIERIRPLDRDACRRELDLPADRLILGYVANVTPDNEQLEGALRIVWKERPDLLVASVGPRWYADRGPIARAVREGRLIDRDRQPFAEIPRYLGAADFVVMPLRDLPFNRCRWPNKFGDYMAAGRATATCAVGDMARVCRRGNAGVAGPPTAQGLASAILELANDSDRRAQCGVDARRHAETHLSWPGRIESLAAFLARQGVVV